MTKVRTPRFTFHFVGYLFLFFRHFLECLEIMDDGETFIVELQIGLFNRERLTFEETWWRDER